MGRANELLHGGGAGFFWAASNLNTSSILFLRPPVTVAESFALGLQLLLTYACV